MWLLVPQAAMYPLPSTIVSTFWNRNKSIFLPRWTLVFATLLWFTTVSANECTAEFDYFQSPTGWLDIQFANLSSGPIGLYTWDFGDGFISYEENPMHSYQNPGTYLVCLTVSSPTKDCYDVKCIQITLPLPVNCYTPFETDTSGSNPFLVYFTAFPPPEVDTLLWDFGDGHTGRGLNISHNYTDTGSYVVSLVAYNHHNPTGCYSQVMDTVSIHFEPCVSAFMMTSPSYNPLQVHFIPISSGKINFYYWQFGDGKTSFEVSPIHTYSDTGTFKVCLIVGNSIWPQYCYDTACQELVIKISRCKADFGYEQNSVYPLKFSFVNQSIGVLNQFIWDFGDGDTSHAIEPIHSFSAPGDYEVKLKVSNLNYPEICTDSIVKIISTGNLSCTASFWWINDSLHPVEVTFFSEITGSPDLILWDFGDGTLSTEFNPVHAFPDTGSYEVRLIVLNTAYQFFCSDTASATLHLKVNHWPRADFSFYLDSLAQQPNLFRFKDLSKGAKITQWHWRFGDGGTSTEQNPVHAYAAVHQYQVCLKIYDFLPPNFIVTDNVCRSLQGRNYYNLGGSVFAGQFPINNPTPQNDSAWVSLYRLQKGGKMNLLRSSKFTKLGYYWFSDVLEGEYLIKAALSKGSTHFNEYFPTWGLSSLTWMNADPITLNKDIFDADIHLIKKNLSGSGPGSASGRVVIMQETPYLQLLPASNFIVFLKTLSGTFLDYTYSDSLGQFEFHFLPLGSYSVESEYPGLLCLTDTAHLSTISPIKKDLLVKMFERHALAIPETHFKIGPQIWPNPAQNSIRLLWDASLPQTQEITIYGIDGRAVMHRFWEVNVGENLIEININHLSPGIYLIKIEPESFSKKFIKR